MFTPKFNIRRLFSAILRLFLNSLVYFLSIRSNAYKAFRKTLYGILVVVGILVNYISVAQTYSAAQLSFLTADVGGEDEMLLYHSAFIVSYNCTTNNPNYVAYILRPAMLNGKAQRTNSFVKDPLCPIECSSNTNDFTNTGFDRGHMTPAADMAFSKETMDQSFYLTNICPQNPNLNRQGWKNLETLCRKWAAQCDSIVVISGPIFGDTLQRLHGTGPAIPELFFKIIIRFSHNDMSSGAYIFPNMPARFPTSYYAQPIDTIEKATGFDFLYLLPEETQNKLEKTNSLYNQ